MLQFFVGKQPSHTKHGSFFSLIIHLCSRVGNNVLRVITPSEDYTRILDEVDSEIADGNFSKSSRHGIDEDGDDAFSKDATTTTFSGRDGNDGAIKQKSTANSRSKEEEEREKRGTTMNGKGKNDLGHSKESSSPQSSPKPRVPVVVSDDDDDEDISNWSGSDVDDFQREVVARRSEAIAVETRGRSSQDGVIDVVNNHFCKEAYRHKKKGKAHAAIRWNAADEEEIRIGQVNVRISDRNQRYDEGTPEKNIEGTETSAFVLDAHEYSFHESNNIFLPESRVDFLAKTVQVTGV